jgi:hypothetical protein
MIRPSTYRDAAGYSVTVKDAYGRRLRVFARTEDGARQIEAALKRGDYATSDRLLREGK